MKKNTLVMVLIISVLISGLNLYFPVFGAEQDDIVPFIYAVQNSPSDFDPMKTYYSNNKDVAVNHLEGLFAYQYLHPQLDLAPRLAKNMGIWSENGTIWTIPLRTDVFWHDGSQFTAADVKWNWDRLNFFASKRYVQHASVWFNNDGDLILNQTNVVDDYTIQFVLNKPWMDFYYLQAVSACYLIKPIEGKEEILIEEDEYQLINGTGPFILSEFISGNKTVFNAHKKYYRGCPDIQKLIFKVYPSNTDSNNALMEHKAHFDDYILEDNRDHFYNDTQIQIGFQSGSCCYFIHLNVNNIRWSMRKAIQYAFDYDYIITENYNNRVLKHNSPIPKEMIGYNPYLDGLPYFNISTARQYLIDDPYYSSLINDRINDTNSDDDWINCARENPLDSFDLHTYFYPFDNIFIENMEKIGLDIILNTMPEYTYFTSHIEELTVVKAGWCSEYWHPLNQIEPMFYSDSFYNLNGLNNNTIDAMIDEAHLMTEVDLYNKINEIISAIIVEQAAALYWGQNMYVMGWTSKYVSNVNDLFNARGEKYFYNVEFALSETPATGLNFAIPGYPLLIIMLCIGISVGSKVKIYQRKKKK